MEQLQKKSEANMKLLLSKAMKQNKVDMTENTKSMVSTLKNSIDSVKDELSNLDQKYNARLELIESRITGIDQRLTQNSSDLKKAENACLTEKGNLKSKIKEMGSYLSMARKDMD